ncbi:expressed unknown protein [Seminavis robusta]|uniref:Uncharacterized protein n=1 Tax=Seminavis robusta TaxID=568900 RepID=A0A9N8DTB4_9STRA|nr:expressed unknown protein [Seminavis robusta]|eukprot:Sro326_g118240.1 n/a (174) ;mRNA; f:67809-68430
MSSSDESSRVESHAMNAPEQTAVQDLLLLDRTDVWIGQILPFLGIGHYAFVGAVNKRMKYLYKEYCEKGVDSPPLALRGGRYKVCTQIAKLGNLAVFQWASSMGFNPSWTSKTRQAAAREGHLDVLQQALENGRPWDAGSAARGGHLHVLEWLHEQELHGCSLWTTRSFDLGT